MIDHKTTPVPISGDPQIRILALPGSLRRGSINRMLCRAACTCVPAHVTIEVFDDPAAIPLFNEDTETARRNGPAGVRRLRNAVARADGLLIATPEYNQSMPGVLKNMIDWLSRPGPEEVLIGKPVAVTGATAGPWGTRLAQKELRHVLQATEALVMAQPMLFIRDAAALFDADERLVDQDTRTRLTAVVTAFASWISLVGVPATCNERKPCKAAP